MLEVPALSVQHNAAGLGKPFCIAPRGMNVKRLICNQSSLLSPLSECGQNGYKWVWCWHFMFKTSKYCMHPWWGMRYKGGTAECREIGRLTPRRPTNHRPHRRRFSFAIIFCSRLFHSKLDFGKPTQKSDRSEVNVRTDKLVTMNILSNPYLRGFCFTA